MFTIIITSAISIILTILTVITIVVVTTNVTITNTSSTSSSTNGSRSIWGCGRQWRHALFNASSGISRGLHVGAGAAVLGSGCVCSLTGEMRGLYAVSTGKKNLKKIQH